jgi:ubiquinone/menaquinone biosynthesis C-methylase UbiE
MPHKFDVSRAEILEDEERFLLPQAEILKRIGVREGVTFADIGCGTGYFTIPASELVGERGRVYAIDIQEEMLELLKRKIAHIGNIVAIKSEEDAIPLPEESVDVAFMGDVLHELEGEGTLREVYRILRRGGVLGVVDWKKEKMEIGPPTEDRLSVEEAKEKIERAGFRVRESFEIPPYHYCLVANKE